ncbi:hypothetical protein AB1Y20_023375 [Prymnesium parvum]|uniref:WAP domain-containing protein n=1 Tax=Prymnesium parvum TaxID=97485 RepID=A0AB34JGP1_PRYPA
MRTATLLLAYALAGASAYLHPPAPSPRPSSPRSPAPLMQETPMQRAARERAEDAAKAAKLAELRTPVPEQGFLGARAPRPCQTSFDCDRPQVCCDLIFTSVCCSAGLMIPTTDPAAQPQAIPIPVERPWE